MCVKYKLQATLSECALVSILADYPLNLLLYTSCRVQNNQTPCVFSDGNKWREEERFERQRELFLKTPKNPIERLVANMLAEFDRMKNFDESIYFISYNGFQLQRGKRKE